MSWIEIVAALLGLANITLIVRRSIWNYPFGIAMVLLYFEVFREAKLYSDALLQLFFLVANVYGWWNWARSRAEAGEVKVERLGWRARMAWLSGSTGVIAGWGWLMHRFTDASLPWWDASVAILSVAAQILMALRKIENWLLWIVINILSIGLYAVKGLWPTLALYIVFLVMALWGLLSWRKAERG